MKYLSKEQILESIDSIKTVNQFFGFTFLAAKRARLPIGKIENISLDNLNQRFLEEFYRLDPRSEFYFRVFRYNNSDQYWLRRDYSGKGLQKLNTTTFKDAFIHEKKTKEWGWAENYIQVLSGMLTSGLKIPSFHLAVWLFRNRSFDLYVTREELLNVFYKDFLITESEKDQLFTDEIKTNIGNESVFTDKPVSWESLLNEFEKAPDIGPNKSGILSYLKLTGIGPVNPLIFEPGRRLNIITGDNGLGKTFILECAWWALTGKWAGRYAYPNRAIGKSPDAKIEYALSAKTNKNVQVAKYSGADNKWVEPAKRETISGLIVYARVDGSFALWDPAGIETNISENILVFNRDEVWDGKTGRIEGLIRDWTKWQDKPEKYPFDVFQQVIRRMSPPEMAPLSPGTPVRIPFDSREIPTITHSYGQIPILHESAGIRRIITLAYLIVWAWNEHKILSEQFNKKLEKSMVIIIDELEAHLHPKWQRAILPALLDIASILSSDLEMQLLIASHSPLVLASSESVFDQNNDKLFHLETIENGRVQFNEIDFIKYGHIDSWLTSNIFDLKQATSNDAENAINLAIDLQKSSQITRDQVQNVTELLLKSLSTEDKFWNRWIFFAKKHGVEV